MEIKQLDEQMPAIGTSNLVRTPGTHLSDIIKHINKTLGRDKGG
jgi:hypothetical protein